ncbi:hypothetical protein COOONC_02346, partial [Cooperia oncophora]
LFFFSQLVLRPVQSVWTVLDREPLSKPKIRPTWADCPKPLKVSHLNPFENHTKNGYSTLFPSVTMGRNGCLSSESMQKVSLTDDSTTSTFSLPDDSAAINDVDCVLTPRNTPRQASFMAAMTRQEIREQDDGT